MDPRVQAPAADLTRQFELSMRLTRAMAEDHAALERVRALRAQLKAVRERSAKSAAGETAAALDAKAASLEGSLGGFEGGPGRSREGLAGLNGQLASLLETVQDADRKPTAAMAAAAEDLEKSLATLLARWNDLRTRDLPALNQELRKASLPPITGADSPIEKR
jgi:chromosome segregation ATPase